MSSVIISTLSDRFGFFIKLLSDALGRRCCPRTGGLSREELTRVIPILNLFYLRALRCARRFKRYADAENPAALNPRPRPRNRPEQPQRREPAKPRLILPRQFGWLRPLVPAPIAFPGISASVGTLLEILRDPDLASLLETCPTLARSLRPLCHALGIRDLGQGRPLPFPKAPRKPAGAVPGTARTVPPPAPRTAAQPAALPLAFPPAPQKPAF